MDKKELLNNIQKTDFALVELNLYLNAYPDCTEALQLYKNMLDESNRLTAEYEATYGPITARADMCENWKWVATPWPWELGVN